MSVARPAAAPGRQVRWDRFWAKVDKDGPISEHRPDLGPCWIWMGALNGPGYGKLSWRENGRQFYEMAHRWAYANTVAPIPAGSVLDHLCRVRRCVRPSHVEPVRNRVNVLRGLHPNVATHITGICQRGHSISGSNAEFRQDGRAACRTCKQARRRESYARMKGSSHG